MKDIPQGAWQLILEQKPDLPFNRAVAEQVLVERSFPHQVKALGELPTYASLRDLLATFRADSSREEFLQFYVEALGGEKAFE